MFCIGEQTVCLRDGMTVTFKNVVHKNNIMEIHVGDVTHQLHFLKGGEVIKVETIRTSLTGSSGLARGSEPIGAPHSPIGD